MQVVLETGLDLDSQGLILAGYQNVASRVGAALTTPAWDDQSDSQGSGLAISAKGRRGSPLMPAWFLELPMDCTSLDRSEADNDRIRFQPDRCVLRFFDYGIAILMIDGHVSTSADSDLPPSIFVREIELLSDTIPSLFLSATSSSVSSLRAAIESQDSQFVISDHIAREMNTALGRHSQGAEQVRPLWVHRLLAFDKSYSDLDLSHLVALQRHQEVRIESDSDESYRFIPGQGTSVVLSEAGDLPAEIVEPLALLNAYYAGSSKYDEAVFWGISQLQAISHGKGRYGVKSKADEILALQERVLLFRAAVDHQAHNLSPQEQVVWQKISAAWNLQPLIDGVASNVATLDGIFQHVAESRRSEQADRLALLVLIFTAASIMGVGATLFPIVDDAPATLPVLERVLVLAGLVIAPLVVIGVVALIVWQTTRRRGR